MRCAECRDLLSAYLDGELPPNELADVREHIESCPECAGSYRALAGTSHLLQKGLVHYTAADVLRARIRAAIAPQDTPRVPSLDRWIRLAAAGIVIAIASSAATLAAVHRTAARVSIADEVLTSHIRSLMPGHLIDVASNDQHNVKPWFDGRLDLSPPVPALDSAGFVLVGGRLDYLSGRPVAAVVYGRRLHRINVYSWPNPGRDTPDAVVESHGYHLVHWRTNDVAFWAVSDLNLAELSQFVTLFQRLGLAGNK